MSMNRHRNLARDIGRATTSIVLTKGGQNDVRWSWNADKWLIAVNTYWSKVVLAILQTFWLFWIVAVFSVWVITWSPPLPQCGWLGMICTSGNRCEREEYQDYLTRESMQSSMCAASTLLQMSASWTTIFHFS